MTVRGETRAQCADCIDRSSAPLRLGTLATASLAAGRREDPACPHCGWTRDQIARTALVGCPLCYEVFGEALSEQFGLDRNAPLSGPHH